MNELCTLCSHKFTCLFDTNNICFLIEFDAIDKMSQRDMATLYRHGPSGHKYFRNDFPLHEYFMKRFNALGGMTPEISKEIGWRR